jgi:2-polyprenyl-3-methyl-5-hydroxy-6-metoxy-1,4-benzoquinol methylase
VIEHLDHPDKFVSECHRLLVKGGVLIITTPNPFFDNIATKIGYESEEEHVETMNLKKVKEYLKRAGFRITKAQHFMFFPFFKLPLEQQIEKVMRALRLGSLMTNQLVVGKKA